MTEVVFSWSFPHHDRYKTRLKPIAEFLETSGGVKARAGSGGGGMSSKWIRGSLPRLVLRRAQLSETAMRLAVLGLAADAERFTVNTKADAKARESLSLAPSPKRPASLPQSPGHSSLAPSPARTAAPPPPPPSPSLSRPAVPGWRTGLARKLTLPQHMEGRKAE